MQPRLLEEGYMTRMLFVVGVTLMSLAAAPQQQGVNPFAQAMVDFKQPCRRVHEAA
jgi:hypothetical protein